MEVVALLVLGAVTGLGLVIVRVERRFRRISALVKHLKENSNVLYIASAWSVAKYCVVRPHESDPRWEEVIAVVTDKRTAVYPLNNEPDITPTFSCTHGELQGFWRPEKYEAGDNDIWLHVQIGIEWHILKLRLGRSTMQALVRALKEVATVEQTKAYRRRRPYIHRGPAEALPATQDIHGAWMLEAPVCLYLMPLMLVFMNTKHEVQKTFPLKDIQQIAAAQRLDKEQAQDGLLRFVIMEASTGKERPYAFAIADYEAWASDLAEAAKRTLEEPMMRKGVDEKGYIYDED